MKKIFLIILSFFILTQNINANRDSVKSVRYNALIGGEINVNLKTKNNACSTPIEKTYSGNIIKYLNTSDNDCNFYSGFLKCSLTINIGGVKPNNSIKKEVNLYGKYSEILKGLGVPEKLYKNNKDILTIKNNIELSLVTDYNGDDGNRKGTNKNFGINEDLGILEYSDESECNPKNCSTKEEIKEIENKNEKILSEIKDEKKRKEKKEELEKELSGIKKCEMYIIDSFCIKNKNGDCKDIEKIIDTKIIPGKLKNFSIHNNLLKSGDCMKKGNDFFCYANDNLKFSFKIDKIGDGINKVMTSVNNETNTAPAFQNNNTYIPEKGFQDLKSNTSYESNFRGNTSFTKKVGKYTIVLQGTKDNDPSYGTNLLSFKLTIVPNPKEIKGEIKLDNYSDDIVNNDGNYANLKDEINYVLSITDKYGNPIESNKINSIYQDCEKDLCKKLNGILISSNNNGILKNFKVMSSNPGKFTESFRIKVNSWKPDLSNNYSKKDFFITSNPIGENKFLAPISLEKIEVFNKNKNGIEEKGVPEIGKNQKYKFILKDEGLKGAKISNGKIDFKILNNNFNFENDYELKNMSFISNYFYTNINNYIGFNGILNILKNDGVLDIFTLKTKNNIGISYNIYNNGKTGNANYNLNQVSIDGTCKKETLGVKIIGNLQSSGKANITGQNSNYTDLSKSDMSANIVKNANNLIRNIDSGKIVNGVKYVNGDYRLDENPDFETIIIKNGNLLINKNLEKEIGIIVLNDNYNVKTNNFKGNIFITNNVEKINAFIYSDGSIRSGKDLNGNFYEDKDLNKSLEIKGSLFSKNTIGGAIAGSEKIFYLPNGEKTNDFKLAEKYDLNFIRKVPINCVDGKDISYNIKIEYNPKIQTNPPKGFTK